MSAVRQSTCQACFQPGHCYRNCAHPSITALHEQGTELYKRFMMAPTNFLHQSNMQIWTTTLSRGMMRVLLTRYALPQNLSPFESIQEWRTWWSQRSYSDSLVIPSRHAIQGAATKEELRSMIEVVYSSLVKEIIMTEIDSVEIMSVNDHIAQMRAAFVRFNRNLRNANLSGEGLENYAQDMIRYLQNIIYQQRMRAIFPPLPIPDLQEAYLIPPLEPIAYVPMPRPAELLFMGPVAQHEGDDMMHDEYMPFRTREPIRQPTFTIDLRLSPPASFEAAAAAHAEEPIQCGICWDEINDERRVITNCNHNFCDGCITSQLDTIRAKHRRSGDVCRYLDLTCALCRQNVHTLSHNITDNAKILSMKNVLYCAPADALAAVPDLAVVV